MWSWSFPNGVGGSVLPARRGLLGAGGWSGGGGGGATSGDAGRARRGEVRVAPGRPRVGREGRGSFPQGVGAALTSKTDGLAAVPVEQGGGGSKTPGGGGGPRHIPEKGRP